MSEAPPDRALTTSRLPAFRIFAYVLASAPLAALGLPIVVHLPQFYASREMGLSLAATGAIFSLCRIADVFIDPLMGYFSDRWRTPWGRRRPLVLLGTPLLVLGVWMVFLPGGPVSALHLAAWLFVMYVALSMVTIPHLSWGAELSPDYHERSRIYGWSQFAIIAGMVGVLVLPAVLEHAGGYSGRVQVAAMGIFTLLLMVPAVLLLVSAVPEPEVKLATHASLVDTLLFIFSDRALRRVILVDLVASTSAGTVGAMFFYFARSALMLPQWAGTLLLIYFISGIVFIPFWMALARRIGKSRTLMVSFLYTICAMPLYLLLPKGQIAYAIPAFIITGANYGAPTFLLRAMMADVSDVDAATNGAERAGVMYSLLTLTNKFGIGWAVGIGFTILGWLGYDPKLVNPPAAIAHMATFFVSAPMVFGAINLALLAGYPLSEARQRATRLEVERRRAEFQAAGIAIALQSMEAETQHEGVAP